MEGYNPFLHTYIPFIVIPEVVAQASQIFLGDAHVLNYLAIRKIADDCKPITA
jgi:hypothetical protein